MESCPGKTVMAGGMGFVLGGAFGLFMSSVSDSPTATSEFILLCSVRLQARTDCFWMVDEL